jgi:hypothetical protein
VKKTTLALPAGLPELEAFCSEARILGRQLALAAKDGATPGGSPGGAATGGTGQADAQQDAGGSSPPLRWNPLSFASARALVLEAENALGGRLDELVIFADPAPDTLPLADAAPRDIEAGILAWAAGHAELIREAARRFRDQGGGTIALVLTERANRGPLSSMAAGALVGLAEGLLAAAGGASSSWRFIALRDESGQPDIVARHLAKLLEEPPKDLGKMQRCGSRAGLFGAR